MLRCQNSASQCHNRKLIFYSFSDMGFFQRGIDKF